MAQVRSEQFHLFFLLDVISEGLAVSLVPRLLACNTVLHPALPTGGSVPLPWGWGPRLSLTKHSLVPPTPESHINVTTLCIYMYYEHQFRYLSPSEMA